jgi:hypothetical protein
VHKEQIVGLAIRLFAVFLFIYILRYAGSLLPYLDDSSSYKISGIFIILTALFPILGAALLWFFPITIAKKLIPDIKYKEPTKTIKSGEIELVALSILGIWVLTSAIPDVVRWATFVYIVKNSEMGSTKIPPDNIAYIIATIVELVIGFWLLFGSKGIIGVIRRMRYAGS